ncbi:MAG: GC-type dockerin domain-anchored protein [Planctomycetota bacterium]
MKSKNNRAIGALTLALSLVAGTAASANPGNNEFIELPLVINVYNGSNVTEAEYKAYVAEANKALKQAKIKITPKFVNAAFMVGNNDSSHSESEDTDARNKGQAELKARTKGKGIKVNFADNVLTDDPNTNGWAWLCRPLVWVEETSNNGNQNSTTGKILAHEIAHALGIKGDGTEGDYTDESRSDELMYAYSSRGCKLTAEQITKIRCKAKEIGTTVKKDDLETPAEKSLSPQAGLGHNTNQNPGAPSPGLAAVVMASDDFDPILHTTLTTVRPQAFDEFADFLFVFDIDNDPATGVEFMGVPGAERAVQIFSELPGPPFAQGLDLIDPRNFIELEAQPGVGDRPLGFPPAPPIMPLPPQFDTYMLGIPKDWLGVDPLVANIVPVVAIASGLLGPTDFFDFPLDLRDGFRGPEMLAPPLIDLGLPLPLPPLPIDGLGFTPGSMVEVEVEELGLVQLAPVGPDGSFALDLPLPPVLPPIPSDFFFVTAVEQGTDLSAFTVVNTLAGPMPCNAADVAPPFGVLDLSDVDAFITAYTAQTDLADLAPPTGVFDLADVDAFIMAFNAGCP